MTKSQRSLVPVTIIVIIILRIGRVLGLSVCLYSESAHLAAIVLRFQHEPSSKSL